MTFRITGPGLYVNRRGEKVEIKGRIEGNEFAVWKGSDGGAYTRDGTIGYGPVPYMADIVGMWEEPKLTSVVALILNQMEDWQINFEYSPTSIALPCGLFNRLIDEVKADKGDTSVKPDATQITLHFPAGDIKVVSEDVWEEPTLFEGIKAGLTEAIEYFEKLPPKEQPMTYDLTKVSERFRALEDGRSIKNDSHGITYRPTYLDAEDDEINANDLLNECDWSLVPETKRVTTKVWVYKLINGWLDKYRSPNGDVTEINGIAVKYVVGAIEGSEEVTEVEV